MLLPTPVLCHGGAAGQPAVVRDNDGVSVAVCDALPAYLHLLPSLVPRTESRRPLVEPAQPQLTRDKSGAPSERQCVALDFG